MKLSEREHPAAVRAASPAPAACLDCDATCPLTRLVPCQDLAMWAWASGPEEADPERRRDVALVIRDRYSTADALDEHGVPVTPFGLPSDFASPAEAGKAFGGPFVALPRLGQQDGDIPLVRFDAVEDPEAAGRWNVLDDRWMLQAHADPGVQESVVHPGPHVTGELCRFAGAVPHHGLHGSGAERLHGPCPPGIESITNAAVNSLGLTGPAVLLLERGPEGTLRVAGVHAHLGFLCADSQDFLAALDNPRPPGPDGWREVEAPDWLRRLSRRNGAEPDLPSSGT